MILLLILTEFADTGHVSGVEGEFEVGLCPLSKPLLFLLDTQLVGLEPLQLEAGVLPHRSELGQRLSQQLLSVHTNTDLRAQSEGQTSGRHRGTSFPGPVSHHSLRSEALGSADAVALHACVAEALTHCFYIRLGNLQDQTQLLAEQQLHD